MQSPPCVVNDHLRYMGQYRETITAQVRVWQAERSLIASELATLLSEEREACLALEKLAGKPDEAMVNALAMLITRFKKATPLRTKLDDLAADEMKALRELRARVKEFEDKDANAVKELQRCIDIIRDLQDNPAFAISKLNPTKCRHFRGENVTTCPPAVEGRGGKHGDKNAHQGPAST